MIFVWTDVAYVQYLNSFYMDTAAMIFLVFCVAAGLHVVEDRNGRVFPVLMVSAAILFAVSKTQHAVVAFVFIPLFIGLAFWSRDGAARSVFIGGSFLLVIGAYVVNSHSAEQYRRTPLYTIVFWRLIPEAPDPLAALKELGLGEGELRLVHTYAYQPQAGMADPNWVRQFQLRCNYATLLQYYLRHPSVPVHFMYQDLADPASRIRPFANLSPDDGFSIDSATTHFGYWTDLRSLLFKHVPWYVIPIALATVAGTLWLLACSPDDRTFAGLVLVNQILAAMEYAIAILTDAAETDRHLLIFHVATEISILLLPLLVARIYQCYQGSRAASVAI